jgi:hypothetical protein
LCREIRVENELTDEKGRKGDTETRSRDRCCSRSRFGCNDEKAVLTSKFQRTLIALASRRLLGFPNELRTELEKATLEELQHISPGGGM